MSSYVLELRVLQRGLSECLVNFFFRSCNPYLGFCSTKLMRGLLSSLSYSELELDLVPTLLPISSRLE